MKTACLRFLSATCLAVWALNCVATDSTEVRVGIVNSSSDAGFLIADKKGYFREEGLEVVFTPFDSAAKMIAPLGAGHLDVGGGSPSAGLYNAIARGISIKIVADKGSTPPGYGYQPLLVRKDLVDSGRFKELKDLKGMKIAGSAPGSASTSTLNEMLKKADLKTADVERVYMGFPQHVMALQNAAVDAALTTEPSATRAIQSGAAVKVLGDDEAYPDHQLAVVLYSGPFAREKPEVARKFMRAYLRGVRDYNDALKDGRLAGPSSDDIIAILTASTALKDPATYRLLSANGCNPNGKVHEPSLRNDLQFFKDEGLIQGNVAVEQAVDHTFVEAALKDLGTYEAKRSLQ
ncbi:ABC transporter substrate-binding protein [Aromatoleum buckelii]|uniref:PhnD/SsuA/transferrin family substrate-binding protein n=1 Tax=Aromatoleum buckelii TaxID=200254 RepID=A0ABX1N6X2_9RHOO|nr:ABC transporter substrate-binding protein [Aromatoleum buckelii]MCK0509526.1 ABC transporter substrate-binding protein [Aromatoleum buckelii]